MQFYFRFILIWLVCFSMQACSRPSENSDSHVVTVEPRSFANSLYYSGIIQPLKTLVIPSPADGAVVEMPFQYGESVKAGQLLFMLSSTKFLSDYKSALMTYVKAKNDFNTSETQLKEGEFLHKNQLISDDEYKTKKSNYYGAQLAMVQAKDSLESLLKQLDIKDVNLYELTIADIDKITQAMHLQMSSEHLRVLSPASGVILSQTKGEEDAKKITKGDNIKQGDVLAMIGDMTGLCVRIKVNELTVNQLRVGQKVKVTGIAFPEHVLNGEIKRIDRQGEATGGGLPNFLVEVIVPKLTAAEQKEIHVGMSAKVEISVDEEAKIMVPMAAIIEKNGNSFVKRLDATSKKAHEVPVKTGKTTIDSVAILSGLKVGDKIVIPH